MKEYRFQEVLVLAYRIFLALVFYQVARLLFWVFNRDILRLDNVGQYLKYAYYGTAFDVVAVLYINVLFIFLSLIPLGTNTREWYQKFLFWVYFLLNGIGYAMNFGDFVYYPFSQTRLTSAVLNVIENDDNLPRVIMISLWQNPFVLLSFIVVFGLWIWLYRIVRVNDFRLEKKGIYFLSTLFWLSLSTVLSVGGIRGDFRHSTRPINLVDANKYTVRPADAHLVLNSVFSFFRTLGSNNFKEVNFVDNQFIKENIHPYKMYHNFTPKNRPNIVIIIVESLGREYIGVFNEEKNIKNYVSYTPFIDSLAKESLIFPNAFANGRQSIHGMSSILAGIPALKDAFTSSPYSNQKIQSIVSVANEMGYDTSFYHGAPNGSMGFMGFANVLGFDHYFGMKEYNNDIDFDGIWAIWDEPFLQYFAKNMPQKKPFLATVFTASSHHPFKIPEKYQGKFKKGMVPMHEPMQYTDFALKKYFETAKKQPWFRNTIFVITGDHTNQSFYKEYQNAVNFFAVPILFYSPNPDFQLKGRSEEFAQQMDIYPTLADIMGYNKPIRSWGRSLLHPEKYSHFIVNSDGINTKILIEDEYYVFDGEKIVGIFDKEDLELKHNLLHQLKSEKIEYHKKLVKAWYQDYMNRVVRKELN